MDWVSDIRMSKKTGKFEVDVTRRRCMFWECLLNVILLKCVKEIVK